MLVDKEKESNQLGALGHGVGSVELGEHLHFELA
jgi:hypothetical protein